MQTKGAGEANKVDQAVWYVGGPTKAANICGVSWYTVRQWRKKGFVPDGRSAVLLSEATKGAFSVRDLVFKAAEAEPDGGQPAAEAAQPDPAKVRHRPASDEVTGTAASLGRRRFYAAPQPRHYSRYKVSALDAIEYAEAA